MGTIMWLFDSLWVQFQMALSISNVIKLHKNQNQLYNKGLILGFNIFEKKYLQHLNNKIVILLIFV